MFDLSLMRIFQTPSNTIMKGVIEVSIRVEADLLIVLFKKEVNKFRWINKGPSYSGKA